jgi:hypothetical protein
MLLSLREYGRSVLKNKNQRYAAIACTVLSLEVKNGEKRIDYVTGSRGCMC